jgi:two-component system response regulator NreC
MAMPVYAGHQIRQWTLFNQYCAYNSYAPEVESRNMPISLLLADDHPIFRQGLKSLLEDEGFKVLGEAVDGAEAVALAESLRPDVAVLDFSMPRLNGLEAAKEIQRFSPRTNLVMLTIHREEHYIVEAMKAGIKGYVLKSEAATALVEAIREAYKGVMYMSPGIARFAVDSALLKTRGEETPEILSPRELQVLQLIAEGNTTRAIAEQLKLTVKTAESYRTGLMAKLDIHDTAGLVRYAVRRGLVKP